MALLVSAKEIDGIWFAMALNEDGKMMACAFSEDDQTKAVNGVVNSIPQHLRAQCQTAPADEAKFKELHELYLGKGEIESASFDLTHVSPFRRNVYLMLNRIPRGCVTTYGALAEKMMSGAYARAVGTAVGSNPLPLIVPCHRVVTSSLEVVNYGMPNRKPSEGAHVKRGLLEREGVRFLGAKVSRDSLWSP